MACSSISREVCPGPVLKPEDLQDHIAAESIAARLLQDLGDTSTVPLAAAALGVDAERIIKSLLFMVRLPDQSASPQPVLVVVGGPHQVDYRAIGARFGVSRKKVRFASAEEVQSILGYPAGGVPPFGHRTKVLALVDAALLAEHQRSDAPIYGGGGDDSTMLEITLAELLRVLQPEVLSVSSSEAAKPKQA
jgi:prolyl-tRNA editing enzyme YbaK/EbsC (Cys-tRNA(Pro) deacylase)